jgi:hypothetical protein
MPLLLLALSCAADDPCDTLCDVSLDAFSSCLDENGQEWGEHVGYLDPDDYLDWCDTYVWELRQLGQSDTCDTRLDALAAGGCAGHAAAWAVR